MRKIISPTMKCCSHFVFIFAENVSVCQVQKFVRVDPVSICDSSGILGQLIKIIHWSRDTGWGGGDTHLVSGSHQLCPCVCRIGFDDRISFTYPPINLIFYLLY